MQKNFRKEGVEVEKISNVPSERFINQLLIRWRHEFCLINGIIFEENLLPKNHIAKEIPSGETPKHDMKPDDYKHTVYSHT
jgi:hypothetical protein